MKLVTRVLNSDHLVPNPVASPANLAHKQSPIAMAALILWTDAEDVFARV